MEHEFTVGTGARDHVTNPAELIGIPTVIGEKAPKKVVDETVAKRDDLAQQLSMVRGRLDVLVAA